MVYSDGFQNIITYRGSVDVPFRVRLTDGYEVDFSPVVQHAYFSRLSGVGQLDIIDRVITGAKHTRYEHSLGVFYLAQEFIRGRRHNLTPYEQFLLLSVSLLHDIGHGPNSHVYDIVAKDYGFPDHKEMGLKIIEEMEEDLKKAAGANFKHNRVVDDITDTLKNKTPLAKLVASKGVSFDRLDYIFRDTYYCGGDGASVKEQLRTIMDNLYFDGKNIAVDAQHTHDITLFIQAIVHNNIKIYIREDIEKLEAFLMRAMAYSIESGDLDIMKEYSGVDSSLDAVLRSNAKSRSIMEALGRPFNPSYKWVTAASIRHKEAESVVQSDPRIEMTGQGIVGYPAKIPELVYIEEEADIDELGKKVKLPKLVKFEKRIIRDLKLRPTELATTFSPQIDRLLLDDSYVVHTENGRPVFESILDIDTGLRNSIEVYMKRLHAVRLITTEEKVDKVKSYVRRHDKTGKGGLRNILVAALD